MNLVHRADELWRRLVDDAGLQPEGWDAPLVETMRSELGLSGGIDFESGLRTQAISAAEFVRAFFRAAQPYVKMWEGLLEMFEIAGATSAGDQIQIVYDFGDDSPVSFNLEHFRRSLQVSRAVLAPFDLRSADALAFWDVSRQVEGSSEGIPGPTELWTRNFWHEQPWPSSLPDPPPSLDNGPADAVMGELWALLEFVLDEVRSVSVDRSDLRGRASSSDRARGGTPVQTLAYLENDMWIANTVRRAWGVRPETAAEWAQNVDGVLQRYRNADTGLTSLTDAFIDFLELPSWSRRCELFSNWVSRVILDGLSDMSPRIHASADGSIRFAFSGCHLMTFDAFTPRLHLVTELRTPLASPVGKGRKKAIQPDITLLFDPITDAAEGPIAIECKQYRKPDNVAFANALTDYARGRPNAATILVDHGRANERTVLKHVAADVVDRCHVVSSLSPDNPLAVGRLQALVRSQVCPPTAPGGVADIASLVAGATDAEFELLWQTGARDVDLHLYVEGPGRDRLHVSFLDKGNAARFPYATLNRDQTVGPGRELLTVHRWIPGARYRLVVNCFSDDCTLASAGARVTARTTDNELTLNCPEDASEDWIVAEFHAPI